MWAQWTMSLSAAVLLVGALIVWVDNRSPGAAQPVVNRSALAEENREAAIVIGQDQKPHVARLGSHISPRTGLTVAVKAFMTHQLSLGVISGNLQSVSCAGAAGGTAARGTYRCNAVASNVTYPFDAVVYPATRQIVYCKRDLPPVPSMNIPVSARCT
jgi:hypothetical protein